MAGRKAGVEPYEPADPCYMTLHYKLVDTVGSRRKAYYETLLPDRSLGELYFGVMPQKTSEPGEREVVF